MHAESGYWRPKPDGTTEVVIAQSTGIVEVQVFFIKKNFSLSCLTFDDENYMDLLFFWLPILVTGIR